MWQIKIVDALVHAHHGLYPEEKTLGQQFMVNISIDFNAANITDMQQTIDYVSVYNMMLQEMQIATPLLETVIERIAKQLQQNIPQMEALYISIQKLNPLFAKQLKATEVVYNWHK